MQHEGLSSEKIREALSFLDYEDREEWRDAAFAIKSELGDSGREMWLNWSGMASNYNLKACLDTWRNARPTGKVRIGTLIYRAMQRGFKLGADVQKVSAHVIEERRKRREAMEREAEIEEKKTQARYVEKAKTASEFFYSLPEIEGQDHPYLIKKDIMAHGCRRGEWTYKDDEGNISVEKNALILPLFQDGEIKTLQAIFPTGEKKIMAGAQKAGSYFVIGEESKIIIICEGFATGATLHEATQKMVFVAIDSGNLIKVARRVRELFPKKRIIIAADNDQYKKVNAGHKAAEKAACEIDADVIYPIFKDISSKPTDFNDLYMQQGYSPITDMIYSIPALYDAREKHPDVKPLDAWDLGYIESPQEVLDTTDSWIEASKAALWVALAKAQEYPAFITLDGIRRAIDYDLVHYQTITSIMKRVQWSIYQRKRVALSAIKPAAWGNKHIYKCVASLEDFQSETPVTLVSAPMGAGKTKRVIKPFSQRSRSFVAIAHRRSLIADLASGLGVKSYDSIKSVDAVMAEEKIAICLPSTQSAVFKPFMDKVANVAIDEISQNIRFTNSKECRVIGADQDAIFTGLKQIISEACEVIACDASIDQTTIDFFEQARPDEKFTIVEQAPTNKDRTAWIYTERADFLAEISMELNRGGKVWLAVESAEKAEVLDQIFRERFKVITITSKNAKTKAVKAFLDGIEEKSREYDLVIASPAISSGVSVEHEGNPHFTMIAGMASGFSICFSDFAQMLGRVRYVKDYHIFLQPNNKRNDHVNAQSILTGLRQAAAFEGVQFKENDYSLFKAKIDTTEEIYRADFANGLVWFLRHFCFDVRPKKSAQPDEALSEYMSQLTKEAKEEHRRKIQDAAIVTRDQAEQLAALQSMTEEQFYSLLAFRLRKSFNFPHDHEISEIDLAMFEGLPKVDRFARILGLTHNNDDSDLNIALRKFEKAQVEAAMIIFDGVDFGYMNSEACDSIIKRVATNQHRFLLSALKLVPSAYGQWKEDKSGKLKPYPIPAKTSKSVAAILSKFGLEWKRTQGQGKEYYYRVTEESYKMMKFYAEQRYS